MITLVIPAHNNLRHLKNAYASIKKHAPEASLIMIDDALTDGTWEWLESLEDDKLRILKVDERKGHTILYDVGIGMAETEIVGIMHADMIMGPNYIENVLKHLHRGKVVCGTRIEPPLHPAGPEKIIQNFGMDFDDLNIEAFESYVNEIQPIHNGETSKGMFAPWVIYKQDFLDMGGHDWGFAPFPYEDSDIFQRWLLMGYELTQSRDAFVYHLTCRGHRWTGEIGKNDDFFEQASAKARDYYIKKWGSWIKNDENQHPILIPIYKKALVIEDYHPTSMDIWFNAINPDNIDEYDIVIQADYKTITNEDFDVIININQIVQQTNETGNYEIGNLKVIINSLEDRSKDIIFINNHD